MNPEEIYDLIYDTKKYPQEEKDYLYPLFRQVLESLSERVKNFPLSMLMNNPLLAIDYLVNEHVFNVHLLDKNVIDNLKNNENYKKRLVVMVTDKIVFNEYLNYSAVPLINKYNPLISTPNLVLNFILNMISQIPINRSLFDTIIFESIQKGFLLCKSVFELLIDGSETEAFSTWRTMHEVECLVTVLNEHPYLVETYSHHMEYNRAYRDELQDKNLQEKLILEIKEKLKLHDLKVKDLKKYIEYGWMYEIENQSTVFPDFKLNFRKGLEYVAGLTNYSNLYEMSSEIAHSSPILIFSRKEYFRDITILTVYKTFFHLEEIFFSLLENKKDVVNIVSYSNMRKDYLEEMKSNLKKQQVMFNLHYKSQLK